MSTTLQQWKVGASGLLLTLLVACTVTGGVGYTRGYSGVYYEPDEYYYGGWSPGYRVGPPRVDIRVGGGHRAAPSIPMRSRGRPRRR